MSLLGSALIYSGSQLLQGYYNNQAVNKQNDANWAMWQASNEYNKPINQMKRFEEAGLNKNLIYGQTNTTSPVSMAGAQPVQVENPLLQYYQMKNAQLSNDKVNAEIAGIKAGIENQNVRTMSDFWDLMNRVKGGYGSDSGFVSKELGSIGNQINTLSERLSKYYRAEPDSDFADQLRMDKAHDALVKSGKIKGPLKRPNLW